MDEKEARGRKRRVSARGEQPKNGERKKEKKTQDRRNKTRELEPEYNTYILGRRSVYERKK